MATRNSVDFSENLLENSATTGAPDTEGVKRNHIPGGGIEIPVSCASSVNTPNAKFSHPRPNVPSANEKIVFFIQQPLVKRSQQPLLNNLVW
jgi:hypothetical protein